MSSKEGEAGAAAAVPTPAPEAKVAGAEESKGAPDAPGPSKPVGWYIGEVRAAIGKKNIMARAKAEKGTPAVFGNITAYNAEKDLVTIESLRTKKVQVLPRGALAAPSRLLKGQKVRTNYGRGRVVSTRFSDEEAVVSVELIDWALANDTKPVVHCMPAECQLRAPTGRELVDELTTLKASGTEQLKAGNYDDATKIFARVTTRLRHVALTSKNVEDEDRKALKKVFVSSCTNLLLAEEKAGRVNNKQIIDYCTRAIEFDPDNVSGLVWKCLLRRADAYMATKAYKEAVSDYKSPFLVNAPGAKRAKQGLARARALKKKRDERHRARMHKASKKFLEDGVDAPADDAASEVSEPQSTAATPLASEDAAEEETGEDDEDIAEGKWSWKKTFGVVAVVGAATLGALWWRRNLRRR